MSLRRPLEDESLVDESLVKKRKALSTVVVVPDDSQSLVVLESHVEAQAPAAQAEEISKEEYQRVKNTILEGKATEAVGLAPERSHIREVVEGAKRLWVCCTVHSSK